MLNLRNAHVTTSLLLRLLDVEAKEVPPVLQVVRQSLVARLLVDRQLHPTLQGENIRRSREKSQYARLTSAASSSLAAATCLTISLGLLATHLPIKIADGNVSEVPPGVDCAVADFPLLVQQEGGPRHHPACPLRLSRHNHQQLFDRILIKCKSLFTCPELLGDGKALVTDDREANWGGSRPLNKTIENIRAC